MQPNNLIDRRATIGKNVFIGSHVMILGSSSIGDACIISNGSIIGHPVSETLAKLAQINDLQKLEIVGAKISESCLIRGGTIIYEKTKLGKNVKTGHNVLIREETEIRDSTLVGTNTVIEGKCKIGNNVKIQTGVYIPRFTTIEDDVFLGPYAVMTNDKYMVYGSELIGPTIKKGARIGANAIILPGIIVGEGAIVGAGSVVTQDVNPHTTVIGVPAKKL